MRQIEITREFIRQAEGSVFIAFGGTRVICTATVEEGVPRFLQGKGQGWITAEYGMLPRSTDSRMGQETTRGKQGGRTVEIQPRTFDRSFHSRRSGYEEIGRKYHYPRLRRDSGRRRRTRTASISGACVALVDAMRHMQRKGLIKEDPLREMIAAVSVGVFNGEPVLDLDYPEDSSADTDMNVIMTAAGKFIEVQGTAEGQSFDRQTLGLTA